MQEKLGWVGLVLIVVFLGIIAFKPTSTKFGDTGSGSGILKTMTVTAATLSNASGKVLSADASRQYARFQNDDATINEWVCLTSITCAPNTGVKLTPGQSFVIDLTDQYVGQVNAIAASGSPVLDITTNP